MIRINLLVAEGGRPQRRAGIAIGQRVTLICGAIFAAVIGLVVWQAVSVRGETARLDEQLRLVDLNLDRMSDGKGNNLTLINSQQNENKKYIIWISPLYLPCYPYPILFPVIDPTTWK